MPDEVVHRESGPHPALLVTALVLATTIAVVAAEGLRAGISRTSTALFYGSTTAITSSFAVWTAAQLGLPTFLLVAPMSWRRRLLRFSSYGILAGLLMALASALTSLPVADSTLRPWFMRGVDSFGDVVVLSTRAALLEETLFRLFAIPFLVSVLMRWNHQWRPRFALRFRDGEAKATVGGTSPKPSPEAVALAIVGSALLFGLSHPFNPLPAILFGLVLGVCYLRGGWESAVTAHLLSNCIVFSSLYL